MMRGLSHRLPPRRMGRENQHAKLRLTDGRAALEAVWWNCGAAAMPEGRFDLAFIPAINQFKGARSVQLVVLDWRAAP
jgi:single-stranded-DNA-specific exonuclease